VCDQQRHRSVVGNAGALRFNGGVSTAITKRTQRPAIPSVSIKTWNALLAAVDDFNRLAPWDWMHDSNIVGLRHPVTKEVLLGSILGRQRTVFALLVYRRDTGHRWLLNTILNDGNSGGLDEEDGAFEQDFV
jgi:hypothetical protein